MVKQLSGQKKVFGSQAVGAQKYTYLNSSKIVNEGIGKSFGGQKMSAGTNLGTAAQSY
jgi:hypothetical protein